MEWYQDYPHIGYDIDGKKIYKPAKGDELDKFLSKMDDPNFWRTVTDKFTGKDIVLTDEEVNIIEKIQRSEYVGSGDPYEPYTDYFTHETMKHPLTNKPPTKRSFVPSKWERKKVMKIVRAIRNGWIVSKPGPAKPRVYDLWKETDKPEIRKHRTYIPAPKLKLPGHEESYNPPPEYLPTEQEIQKWKEADPEDREQNFLPQRFNSLREVPAYAGFVKERFDRCLDLYLCPRKIKHRVNIDDPSVLLPKLPSPNELKPFPTEQAIIYKGHTGMVRCVSVDSSGQWLASGSDDGTVRLWEVDTGYCLRVMQVGGTCHSLAFNPNPQLSILAVAVNSKVYLLNHRCGDHLIGNATDMAISTAASDARSDEEEGPSKVSVVWSLEEEEEEKEGRKICLTHSKPVKQVTWHHKGDYFATVMPEGGNSSVHIHQLTKWRTQNPFNKSKGLIQKVLFHPTKPLLFVATQRYVRIYNLVKLELIKKLMSGVKWISSMDVHPQGDNVITGSYDKRLTWFDSELSVRPYTVIRNHKKAIRQVCFHKRYPLLASVSDDGTAMLFHGMVYNDLLQNPLIVPLKILRGHKMVDTFGILDCVFHPTQPWLITTGADSTVRLYT